MRGRARSLAGMLALASWTGCGHDVAPNPDYTDPASIPICCESDPSASCCSLVGFGFAGGIQLDWNAEDEIFRYVDGWNLYRAVGEAEPALPEYRRLNASVLVLREFLDRDIVDGLRYWYRLTSVTPAGVESVPTPALDVRADYSAPSPPTGLAGSANALQVSLTWNPSPEPDLDHYNVYREPPFPSIVFPRAPGPSYIDTYVQADTTYRYWVTAVDQGFNESAPGDTVSVTVPAASASASGNRIPRPSASREAVRRIP